jgi:uncharacterized protein YdaU (DUF1376 family)
MLYARDFLTGTMTMSPAEVGAYMRCLCYQWDVDGIPADDATQLARIIGAPVDDALALWSVVRKKFRKLKDGLYWNARLEAIRSNAGIDVVMKRKGGQSRSATAKRAPSGRFEACGKAVENPVEKSSRMPAVALVATPIELPAGPANGPGVGPAQLEKPAGDKSLNLKDRHQQDSSYPDPDPDPVRTSTDRSTRIDRSTSSPTSLFDQKEHRRSAPVHSSSSQHNGSPQNEEDRAPDAAADLVPAAVSPGEGAAPAGPDDCGRGMEGADSGPRARHRLPDAVAGGSPSSDGRGGVRRDEAGPSPPSDPPSIVRGHGLTTAASGAANDQGPPTGDPPDGRASDADLRRGWVAGIRDLHARLYGPDAGPGGHQARHRRVLVGTFGDVNATMVRALPRRVRRRTHLSRM